VARDEEPSCGVGGDLHGRHAIQQARECARTEGR
jgi:hypothetical protein